MALTPERWREVKTILQAALERDSTERAAFLDQACGSDPALRQEVESLLVEEETSFLEQPALQALGVVSGASGGDGVLPDAGGPALTERLRAALAERYEVERELGRGGTATVFLAHDRKHRRSVALKVLNPQLAAAVGPERFVREIELTARLQHPHILPLHDSGEADGLLYYVMPYVDGESLRARLRRAGRLSLEEALRITGEVADALNYAHEQGVVHRDIKPENILLWRGHALVADFGIAHAISRTAAGALMNARIGTVLTWGTPAYMSPERASAEAQLDGRSDIYSLGCVFYEMLAGEPPFTGPTAHAVILAHLTEQALPLGTRGCDVPEAVEQALMRALAKDPAERFQSAGTFAEALAASSGAREARMQPPRWPRVARSGPRGAVIAGVCVVLLAVVGSATIWLRPGTDPKPARDPQRGLDSNLVVVAPFDALDPSLALWREGMVDVLSRNLDGAGPLRAVPPTVVVRRWRGRPDPMSAAELGRNTRARLAVVGGLMRSGSDSVRLTATLLDVLRERSLGEIEVRGRLAYMDRLTDSLAVGLLRALGRTRPVGAVRYVGLGARSLPALKAFLQAEQHYRRAAYDSARAYAEEAVALDTAFALAYRRLASALEWQAPPYYPSDSLTHEYTRRAATLNHGLAPRDSLLVSAYSRYDSVWIPNRRDANPQVAVRLFSTLEEAVRRYPDDPEAWFQLGQARAHAGFLAGRVGWRYTLEAFERVVALDPLFVPAYYYLVVVSYSLGDDARARRFGTTWVALDPRSKQSRGYQAIDRLLALGDSTAQERLLDTLPQAVALEAQGFIVVRPDSTELAVRITRHLVRATGRGRVVSLDSTAHRRAQEALATALIFPGHLREAVAVLDTAPPLLFPEAAALGLVPAAQVAAVFNSWLRERPLHWAALLLPWWSMQRDTARIRRFVRAVDSTSRAHEPGRDPAESALLETLGRAHLALALRDTAAAIREYEILVRAPCQWWCQADQLTASRLLAGRGRLREAARILYRPPTIESDFPPRPSDLFWFFERGRVAERLGNQARAMDAYRYVATAWTRADPELQPNVTEARRALARLSALRASVSSRIYVH